MANRRPDLVTHAPAYQQRRLLGATPSRRWNGTRPCCPAGDVANVRPQTTDGLPPEPFRVVASYGARRGLQRDDAVLDQHAVGYSESPDYELVGHAAGWASPG